MSDEIMSDVQLYMQVSNLLVITMRTNPWLWSVTILQACVLFDIYNDVDNFVIVIVTSRLSA